MQLHQGKKSHSRPRAHTGIDGPFVFTVVRVVRVSVFDSEQRLGKSWTGQEAINQLSYSSWHELKDISSLLLSFLFYIFFPVQRYVSPVSRSTQTSISRNILQPSKKTDPPNQAVGNITEDNRDVVIVRLIAITAKKELSEPSTFFSALSNPTRAPPISHRRDNRRAMTSPKLPITKL